MLSHQQQGSGSTTFHGNGELLRHVCSKHKLLRPPHRGSFFHHWQLAINIVLETLCPISRTVFTSGWPGSYTNPRRNLRIRVEELRAKQPEDARSHMWVPCRLQVSWHREQAHRSLGCLLIRAESMFKSQLFKHQTTLCLFQKYV